MEPTKFQIEVDEAGHGRVLIDGVDWSNKIRGFTITARAGELTKVELQLLPAAVEVTSLSSQWTAHAPILNPFETALKEG